MMAEASIVQEFCKRQEKKWGARKTRFPPHGCKVGEI